MNLAIMIVGNAVEKNRDWRRCIDNIHNNLINCLGNEHNISTYIVAQYMSDDAMKEMMTAYGAKKFSMDTIGNVTSKYTAAMDLIDDEDVDFVICTRPDMIFLKSMCEFNIDFDKFNFLFQELNMFQEEKLTDNLFLQLCCDNFFAFPKKYSRMFKQAIINRRTRPEEIAYPMTDGELHTVYQFLVELIGKENINFMTEPKHSGNGVNDVYRLDRYNLVPGDV